MFGSFKEKYYPSGVLLYEGSYKNGKSNGYGKSYFLSSVLQYEGLYTGSISILKSWKKKEE